MAALSLVLTGTVRGQAAFAGTYTGTVTLKTTSNFPGVPAIETPTGAFSVAVSSSGALSGDFTGTVNASGAITFGANTLGLTTGQIASNQLTTPYGSPVGNGVLTYRLISSNFSGGGGSTAVLPPW